MNHKLINRTTKEEIICTKVVVDGFDYYINDKQATEGEMGYISFENSIKVIGKYFADDWKKVIATNNPNIDLPQIIDEVEFENLTESRKIWKKGYNKAKETHPFSEEDVLDLIQSLKDYTHESHVILGQDEREPIEFLEIWKSKQIKTLYYE